MRSSSLESLLRPDLSTSRRGFLGGAAVATAGLALSSTLAAPRTALARLAESRRDDRAPTDLDTKFATVLPINTWQGGGAWAIISKWGETFTLCNSGIISGKDAVIIVDGFNTPGGSQWAARMAKQLTGRDPTHVIVTHYHFDHTDGLSGYLALQNPPMIISTAKTRELLASHGVTGGGNLMFQPPASPIKGLKRSVQVCVLPDTIIEDASKPLTIDIGGRSVTLRDRAGHTLSDLNVEIPNGGKDGQKIVYAGDMIFNKVFPVYLDAIPSALRSNVAEVIAEDAGKSIIVPGHGGLTTGADLKPFLALIDYITEAAKKTFAAGTPAKAAAATFTLPPDLKDYTPGNPFFVELAFQAVYRELAPGK